VLCGNNCGNSSTNRLQTRAKLIDLAEAVSVEHLASMRISEAFLSSTHIHTNQKTNERPLRLVVREGLSFSAALPWSLAVAGRKTQGPALRLMGVGGGSERKC